MNEEYIRYRLEKARESLRDANHLFNLGSWNASMNRLYYAGFYAVSALLIFKEINVKTHDGVKNQFNLHFIKTQVFAAEYGEIFSNLMNLRQKGDYADLYDFYREDIEPFLEPAENLVNKISKYILGQFGVDNRS